MFRRTRLVCVSSIPILIIDIAPAGVRDEHYALRIDLPNDTPVTVVSVNSGQTNSMIPGGAILIDLHVSLSLRNSSHRHIRGVSRIVVAEEVAPGRKGSVLPPNLNIAEGDVPLRIDPRLIRSCRCRPFYARAGKVGRRAVFDNLQFFGPSKLSLRRSMTIRGLDARLDRERFKSLLTHAYIKGLQKEILASLNHHLKRSHAGPANGPRVRHQL